MQTDYHFSIAKYPKDLVRRLEVGEIVPTVSRSVLVERVGRNVDGNVRSHTAEGVAIGGRRHSCQAGERGYAAAVAESEGTDAKHGLVDRKGLDARTTVECLSRNVVQ